MNIELFIVIQQFYIEFFQSIDLLHQSIPVTDQLFHSLIIHFYYWRLYWFNLFQSQILRRELLNQ